MTKVHTNKWGVQFEVRRHSLIFRTDTTCAWNGVDNEVCMIYQSLSLSELSKDDISQNLANGPYLM